MSSGAAGWTPPDLDQDAISVRPKPEVEVRFEQIAIADSEKARKDRERHLKFLFVLSAMEGMLAMGQAGSAKKVREEVSKNAVRMGLSTYKAAKAAIDKEEETRGVQVPDAESAEAD